MMNYLQQSQLHIDYHKSGDLEPYFKRGKIRLAVKVFGVLAAIAASSQFAVADEPSSLLSEDVFLAGVPVILSATRLEQPIEDAPASITILDRESIRASGARELADIFRLVPGFLIGSETGYQRSVGYLGLQDAFSRRMQVLIDGRSVYSPLFGGVLWSDLPLAIEDIQRIEIVRGPNSVAYGANAFLGVINIITNHASEGSGSHLKFITGSDGVRKVQFRHGANLENLDYRLTLQYEEDNGFENSSSENYNGKRLNLFSLRSDYQATELDSVSIQVGVKAGATEQGQIIPDVLNPVMNSNPSRAFLSTNWSHTNSQDEEYNLRFYYDASNFDYDFTALFGPGKVYVDSGYETARHNLEFEHRRRLSNSLRTVWGFESRYETVGADQYLHKKISTRLSRFFGNVEWHTSPQTVINFGAMVENNDLVNPAVSPRLAFNHQLTPNHSVRASLTRATRTPSVFEAQVDNYTFVTNLAGTLNLFISQPYLMRDTLVQESIIASELGYLFQSDDRKTSSDVKLFHYKIENLIRLYKYALNSRFGVNNLIAGTGSYNNDDSATLTGIEWQFDHRPSETTRFLGYVSVTDINASRTSTLASEAAADIQRDIDIMERSGPTQSASLMLIQKTSPKTELSILFQHTSDFAFMGGGDPSGTYNRIDLRLARNFRGSNYRGTAALVFQNIGPEYVEFETSEMMDSRVYLSTELSY